MRAFLVIRADGQIMVVEAESASEIWEADQLAEAVLPAERVEFELSEYRNSAGADDGRPI